MATVNSFEREDRGNNIVAQRPVDLVTGETPAGTINGLNASFTLAQTPAVGAELVFLNGVHLTRNQDYTLSGDTLTLTLPPVLGDQLRVTYYA